ncbi:MAG: hypothetical protein A3G24_14560 [Betaproteobacteria bacterium RIFCSPLOWO2_12_FULL_62_13]|nr:MAG: hypothetical protein A3G24_14560 [Betaproteobacteria bacterium RIFCSPLOWO2_12_FULL_62_13]
MSRIRSLPTNRTGTQTVERSFQILKEIAAHNTRGATLPHLAEIFGLHRTTVHRLLQCLVRQGAIRRDAASRRFFLGPLAVELSIAVRPQLDLKAAFGAAVSRVAEQTGDTTFLIVRSGNDGVCIDRRLGSYPIKTIVVEVGTRRPLGIGAGSLAIFSALPDADMERIAYENAQRLSRYDRTPDSLLRSAKAARKAGYASAPVYGVEGATAVGVPILDPSGTPIAGLSVAAITKRMARPRQLALVQMFREEALKMTDLLRDTNVADHG